MGGAAETAENYTSDAEKTGAAIGTGLGMMFLLFIWALGAVVLGSITYFTRAKK